MLLNLFELGFNPCFQISLLSLDGNENIPLPSGKKPIKDIRISPLSRRLALLASMEKTISIFRCTFCEGSSHYNGLCRT